MAMTPQREVICERRTGETSDYGGLVLQYFDDTWADEATVADLAAYVHGRGPSDGNETRVSIYLHHATLPRQSDLEILDYDTSTRTVRYREDGCLEALSSSSDSDS